MQIIQISKGEGKITKEKKKGYTFYTFPVKLLLENGETVPFGLQEERLKDLKAKLERMPYTIHGAIYNGGVIEISLFSNLF